MKRFLLATASGVALFATSVTTAQAQSSAPPPGSAVDEVVVTGSRIARRDYTGNSPIVTVGEESLRTSPAVTLDQVLNRLPQFTPSSGATFVTPSLVATANLRSLGINRSLVLIDGHRAQPATADGAVDLNTVPTGLIQTVETITGGASAAYGSDAISGVVNIKLKRNFEGIELDYQYGGNVEGASEQQQGDKYAHSHDFNITVGGKFHEDRGRAVASFNYTERNEVMRGASEFFKYAFNNPSSGAGVASLAANPPSQAAMNAVFAQYGAAPGAVGRTQSVSFNADGTVFNNAPGATGPLVNYRGVLNETSGEGPYHYIVNNNLVVGLGAGSTMWVPMERYNAFFRTDYALTPSVNVYAQLSYIDNLVSWTSAHSSSGGTFPANSIPVTNPYIPADLRVLLASRANPNADFSFQRGMIELPRRREVNHYHASQIEIGSTGELPVRDWTYEVYASRGSSVNSQRMGPNPSISAVNTLLRAPDGGMSICGSYNPFGYTQRGDPKISVACQNYITRYMNNELSLEQEIIEGSFQGTLFTLPAGEVKFAVGADYRNQTYTYNPDFILASGDVYGFARTTPSAGSQSVKEAFGELLVPVVKDLAFAKSANLTFGYRYSKYDGLKALPTYRVDGDWQIIDPIRLRAGYARAARAPSLNDLYQTSAGSLAQIGTALAGTTPQFSGDPCDVRGAYSVSNRAQVRQLCLAQGVPGQAVDTFTSPGPTATAIVSGNRSLDPEIADTITAGVVLRSPFRHPLLSGLSGSIDYYKIKIEDAINPASVQLTLSKCFNLDGSNPTYSNANQFCRNMVRNPADGVLGTILQPTLNLAKYETSGIDFQVDWSAGLGDLGLNEDWGRIALSVVGTYVKNFSVQTAEGAPVLDFAGSSTNGIGTALGANSGALPELKVNVMLTYMVGPATVGVKVRHISSMHDASKVTSPTSTVPGTPQYNYLDLSGRFRVRQNVELRGGMTNVTDRPPPNIGGVLGVTDQALFDVFGRQFYLGVKATF